MKWTEDQLAAIETRNKNILVSAAAGSGKTALLIERIVQIILKEKVEVDELLILTFTRGAAGEMKNRLSKVLTKALEDKDNNRSFIMKQLNGLGGAMITTLHSFCLSILRQYFQKVKIDPGFMLGNETEMTLMRKETLEEVFEMAYLEAQENKDSGFPLLIEKYSGNRNDQGLKDSVESFYDFLSSQADPEDWCQKALEAFNCTEESLWKVPWGIELKKILETELEGALDYAIKAEEACLGIDGFEKTYAQMLGERETVVEIQGLFTEDPYQGLSALKEVKYPNYKGSTKIDKSLSDEIKDLRTKSKGIIQGLQKNYAQNMEAMVLELHDLGNTMEDFVNLTMQFIENFREKKEKKNLVDFNDLERLALEILQDPEIAELIRDKYQYIFLDEYQDTNEVQETIIQKIARENNYFMVGDVKQSVYRFRSADPKIFIEKYHRFMKDASPNETLINLSRNFRSAQGVIDSVNCIFQRIMSKKLGEIDYDEYAMLHKGLLEEGPYEKTEIHLLETDSENPLDLENEENESLNQRTSVETEARFIGNKIQSLVGTKIFDTRKNKERFITYGDFGILMRSVVNRGDVYQKVFTEMGIPSYFDGGSNYYESLEIRTILNLLTLIDNHRQDLPLLSIMTSPIGGFTTAECTKLRIDYPGGFYYQGVENHGKNAGDELSKKIKGFYKKLDQWRKVSKILTIEDFLWTLYLESGYYAFVGALPGGEQRQCNLRILLKRGGDYKKSTLKGLYQFIRFIENMKKHKQDISPPASLSKEDSVVRIMTIHKSKGLEFPIVFLTGTGKGFNKRSNQDQILFHKELGICPDMVNLEKRFKRSSLAKEVCKARNNMEMLSEEMRLLYVAMTRAEEKLYIVATVKNLEKENKKWLEEPDDFQLLKSNRAIDWVMLGILGGKSDLEIHEFLELDSFKIYEYQGLENPILKEKNDTTVFYENKNIDPEVKKEVFRRLDYVYPHKVDKELPSKMSVSEIKELKHGKEKLEKKIDLMKKPKFLEEITQEFSGAQRGTALHLFMEAINLKPLQDFVQKNGENNFNRYLETYLREERTRLIKDGFLSEALGKTLDLSKVLEFYDSPLGIRLLSSPKVKREIPFNYEYSPGKVKEDWKGLDDKIMVQGMIDCAFMEEGSWVLIDYKTDYYRHPMERESLIKNYKTQIDIYSEALENLTGVLVKEKILSLIVMKENVILKKI